jgi:putative zinc finger/helix-turn-helix YgiT family protein
MTKFCYKCDETVPVSIGIFVEEYPVKGEVTTIRANVTTCDKCGEKLWDSELDDQNLKAAFNQYRAKHGLLLPEEIKEIRMSQMLDYADFDWILGFSSGLTKRFENGSLQTPEQDSTIRRYKQSLV